MGAGAAATGVAPAMARKSQPFHGKNMEDGKKMGKNGKTGELGQDRLEVRWEAVVFLFNVVNLNV